MGIMNMAIQPVYPGLTISYGMLLKYNWPFIFFIFGFMWLTLKWHEHATKNDSTILDVSAAKQFYKESYEKLGVMTKSEKICLVMLVVLFGWLFAYSFGVLKLDIVYGFILVNTICFLLGIAEEKDVTRLSWGIFAVVMAFVSVGTIATQLQLTNIISSGIASVFSGVGPVIGSFCSLLFGTIANFVLTPYAMMTLLPTVVGSYCVELGWNFLPHLMSTMIASDIIFFPYEYPLVLILFAFGICNMSNTVKLLSVKALVCIAFVAAVMIPYWFVMGLY